VILTEKRGDEGQLATSVVYSPLVLGAAVGVLMLEFTQRYRLDEFLAIRESVALELSRFIASQRRERRLRRELEALARVSDAAPALLTSRTLDDLCEYLARVVAEILDCERVSVRLLGNGGGKVARHDEAARRRGGWQEEDEERFLKLKKSGETYSLAFLDYHAEGSETPAYHSLVAVPIVVSDEFAGGIIAYDRRSSSALEDATFSDVDRTVLEQVASIAASVVETLRAQPGSEPKAVAESETYESILSGNMQRLKKVLDNEMARADRYHHSFTLLLFRIRPLRELFERDASAGLSLVDEISRGIQTRTRKTDYSAWVRHDTLAMLSLEGGKRVRFLVSRMRVYLAKDFETATGATLVEDDVLVGQAVYPGEGRTPEALIAAAEATAAPPNAE
jgi:GAF domain-containing protein